MKRDYKLARAKKELNAATWKHLQDVVVPVQAPDAGADDATTLSALLKSAGNDHKNLRNIYIAGGFMLAVQKAVKIRANELGPQIEAGKLTKDAAVQILVDLASSAPVVTVRGEGAGTGRRSVKAEERGAARGAAEKENEMKARARAKVLASTDPRERAAAAKLFADLFGEDVEPAKTEPAPTKPGNGPKGGKK